MDRERERETEDEQRQPAQQEVVVPKAAAPPPPSLSTDVALAPVPAPLPPTLVSDGFARIGARTALSFAFAFLRQAWRTEDDSGLCEQVFHEAREILQELPVGLIFDSRHVSDVWIEVVDRTMTFLTRICQGPKGEVEVPQSSRHAALSLLLELSLHRAKLHKLLGIVFLLLQLATGGMGEEEVVEVWEGVKREPGEEVKKRRVEERTESGGAEFPLVPFLRRLNQIPTLPGPHSTLLKPEPSETSDPIRSFLEYFTLPNDESTSLNPGLVATVTLSHLDRLASPYYSLQMTNDQSTGEDDQHVSQVYHWGGDWGSATSLSNPHPLPLVVELRAKTIAASDKELFVLSVDGTVYKLTLSGKEKYTPTPVVFPAGVKMEQLSLHPNGRHCLALSRGGEVFSWGAGDNGRLGLGDTRSKEGPLMVDGLRGKNVVFVVAGGEHSAAITEDGALYTWGKGSYGRLGHGNMEDRSLPTLVKALSGHKIVAVGCGSGDAHTIALEEDGSVWSWGDGDCGKLGRGGSEVTKVPKLIPGLTGVKSVVCGSQFTLALTKDGKVFSWGSGENHQLGHGKTDPVRKPCQIDGLSGQHVVGVAAGSHHCLALTEGGEVFGWGASIGREQGRGEGCIPVPTVLSEVSKSGVVYLSCGSHESFVCCQPKAVSVGAQLPFCVDVCRTTFEQLDRLLHQVCEGLSDQRGALSQPHHERECMAVAALNLLRLQFYVSISEHVPPATLGLQPGSPLLSSIKQCVVELARSSSVIDSIQSAAQAALRTGWSLLLPTVSERASTLSQLLPARDVSLEGEVGLPAGQQFMINLLVDSLMADRGLEDALTAAIAAEVRDGRSVTLSEVSGGPESAAVPLLHLVRQLLGNATGRQLSALKKLSEMEEEKEEEAEEREEVKAGNEAPTSEYSSSLELLTLFQRLLLCIIYSHIPSTPGDTGMEPEREHDAHVQGSTPRTQQVHHNASRTRGPHYAHGRSTWPRFPPSTTTAVGAVLLRGPMGVVLPEISLGLVVLQLRMPLLLQDGRCVIDGRRLGEAAGRAQPAATFLIGGGRGGDGLAWSQETVYGR
ncbi:E3 ubiquitin-protein ligase HERC2 [Geodia barretti]|nr:E3 ubiquitin-protein ligase HERC2 [Geodia barretti]